MAKRLAIVERLPGHTEVMGGFVALAGELGYESHLLFESADRFHMVDYFRSRLGIESGRIHEWSCITNSNVHFDVILLNTSFTWLDYGPWLQHCNAHQRLLVVHHHPEDIELNPYGASIYLTPAGGHDKWIFPLYSKPHAPLDSEEPSALIPPAGSSGLPALTCLGTFEGKDIVGAHAYLQAGGKLLHYDRHPCGYFTAEKQSYTQYVGLDGLQLAASLAQQSQPMFLWLPIVYPSDYMVCRFTAALITGVDRNCVMVMPQRLRQLYGFPESAVIAYDASVTEPSCLARLRAPLAEQTERQRQLRSWAAERWEKNLAVFRSLLGLAGT